VRLAAETRRRPQPDAVVVGHLGHLDVHLARRLHPRAVLVLDHLISLADTAVDRGAGGTWTRGLLGKLDDAAITAADVIVVDTQESLEVVPPAAHAKAVVVPVGATQRWIEAGAQRGPRREGPLRVVFYGLYTPLQGTPVIGAALRLLRGVPIEVTMIGGGQDLAATRAAASDTLGAGAPALRWVDWVPAEELADEVAAHDVCLGIFGTGPKARRVVATKAYQGTAAGCAIVTSDTAPQRAAFGEAACYVTPGDAQGLAAVLAELAADPTEAVMLGAKARARGGAFSPRAVVAPLDARLAALAAAGRHASGRR